MSLKILCIIPARGGSKGIKDKNIIDVCGKPLIAYSINSAKDLKAHQLIDTYIVSTDCEKIAEISKNYGAEVPFLRPKEISQDASKSIEFIIHALDYYKENGKVFDAVMLLQPTSPLRDFNMLKEAVTKFNLSEELSLISCYKEEYINDLVMYKQAENNTLMPLNPLHNKGVRRQDHGMVFVRNGAVYLTKTNYLYETKQIISDTPVLIEMKKTESVNVDTMEDLVYLRKMICG